MSTSVLKNYYPRVGMGGSFTVKPPFDAVVYPQVFYRVIAIESIRGLISRSFAVKEEIYDANGIPEEYYLGDLESDVAVLTLQNSAEDNVLIPMSFVLTIPQADGVIYSSIMLGVSLGAMPVSQDLSRVKEKIADLVLSELGVDSVIEETEYAAQALITSVQHAGIQVIREKKRASSKSNFTRISDLENTIERLKAQQRALEAYILKRLKPAA